MVNDKANSHSEAHGLLIVLSFYGFMAMCSETFRDGRLVLLTSLLRRGALTTQ